MASFWVALVVLVLLGGGRVIFLPHALEGTVLRGSAWFAPEQNTLTTLFNKFCSSDQSSVMGDTLGLLKPRAPNVQIFMKVRAR